MGVVSWLALVALVAYRIPTACAVDDVILNIYSTTAVGALQNVTKAVQATASGGFYYAMTSDECFSSLQHDVKNIGNIYITDNTECTATHKHGLLLVYSSASKSITTPEGDTYRLTELNGLQPLFRKLIARVQSSSRAKEDSEDGVLVPILCIIFMALLVGLLLALSCIFFAKYRSATKKIHPAEKTSCKSSKGGSSQRSGSSVKKQKQDSSRSSKSSSSKSGRKSSKGKKERSRSRSRESSSRSNKSASTMTCGPTSVKVVSVPPPKQNQNNCPLPAFPLFKDEVTAAMAESADVQPVRNLKTRIEMPMNEHEFIRAMKTVIQFVIDFYRNPAMFPVSTEIKPNQIFNKLPVTAPENPEPFSDVWEDFNKIIIPGCVQWQHPQFHAFFPCGRSYPDILAETLISSLGTVGFTWSANPAITELDTAMINWMGRALGIPECFLFRGNDCAASDGGGWIADTASDAIFCAVMAARHVKIEQELDKAGKVEEESLDEAIKHTSKKYEKRAEIMSKLVAYGSYESHSSFEKACKMACVRCRPIKVFEEDDWGMRRKEVEKEMDKDKQRGLIPFYLHVALGTTSTATSDHLKELTPLKELHKVWVHVDAAYAGSAWVVEKYRKNEGIDKVDSININLHKFFLTSTSVTLFWTRRQHDYKQCFRVDPSYLKKKSGANDLRDWGIQLSRRFKSLKVYMLLRMYGLKGMRAYIQRIIEMTDYMESHIVKLPNIRKFGKTNYGLFCVQYYEDGWTKEQVNAATNRLCEFMNNSHKMVLTHSNVRGHDILRVCVTLERTTTKDIDDSVAIFKQLLQEFKKKKAEDSNFIMGPKSPSREVSHMQNMDMGIIGSPNPTLAKTPTNVTSTVSCESLVGPRTAQSHLSVAQTAATQNSTMLSIAPRTDISSLATERLPTATPPLATPPPPAAPAAPAASAAPAAPAASAAPAAPAASAAPAAVTPAALPSTPSPVPPVKKMPPLTPAFEDPSTKSGGTSSYNAPASAPPTTAQPPVDKPVTETYISPALSAPEVTARSDTMTNKN